MTSALPPLLPPSAGGTNYSQPGSIPAPPAGPAGDTQGICTLTWQNQVFRFRTNPNEIWWSYELLKAPMQTYGGQVIQLLGVKLGDLQVKVDCGAGGWPYLVEVVGFLRNLLSDQRNGNPAIFYYAPRNWKLQVYALSVPFQDQVEATVREIELNFKIQQDITGFVGKNTLDAELARLQNSVYGPGQDTHNKYNSGSPDKTDAENPGGPTYSPSGIVNTVDTQVAGNNPGGVNPLASALAGVPGISNSFGLSNILAKL